MIRRWFVEQNIIDAVILLPDNLFYNTTAAAIVIVMRRERGDDAPILLINASSEYEKGRPKNYLSEASVRTIVGTFHARSEMNSVGSLAQRGHVASKDFTLSPSVYVDVSTAEVHRGLQEIVDDLATLDRRQRRLTDELRRILQGLGLTWSSN